MSLIIVFHNDSTGGETDANYNVRVMIGGGTPERTRDIASGRVEGHNRSDGWKKLVRKFLDERRGVCETCNGKGFGIFSPPGELTFSGACPHCDGTGCVEVKEGS